jgi:histidyl-tRNA synthetase
MGEELACVRWAAAIISSVFERFGYQEVETPVFEHLDLFTKKSGSMVIKQMYTFKDKSGRDLALRPELTAPVIRLYIQHLKSAPKPLKLCYFGSCFRYEEPQAWRWRQFFQAGAEIIGSQSPQADAELVLMAVEVVRELGLKNWELRIGDVGILRSALQAAGVCEERQDPVLRAVDSKDPDRIAQELERAGVKEKEELQHLFSLRGDSKVLQELPHHLRAGETVRRFKKILQLLDSLGVAFEVDLGIARGLDYYTGFVFEIYAGGVQVAGGGRYDTLVETLGGPPTPATGVGFGVDRLAKLALDAGQKPKPRCPRVMVIPVSEEDVEEALRVAQILRANGIPTDFETLTRKLSKSLAHANALNIPFVVLIGRSERAAGRAMLRDMRSGRQELLEIKALVQRLKPVS